MDHSKELDVAGVHLERLGDKKQEDGGTNEHAREIHEFENRQIDFATIMAVVSLAFSYEAHLLSFVLPVTILLTINADIGPSTSINWVATASSLSIAVIQTVAGSCSDIFGRRNFTILGNLLGLVGCITASRANTVAVVIGGMVLQGIGAGPQQLAYAGANEIVPKKNRGETAAFLSLAALPGSAFGSAIAYALVARLNWRWAYYVGAIANGVALILTIAFYWPPSFFTLHPDVTSQLQQLKKLDWIGLLLFAGGLTSFLLGVQFGGNPYKWTSATVLAPLIIGAVAVFILFPLDFPQISPCCALRKCSRMFEGSRFPFLISLQVLWPQEIHSLFTTKPQTIGWYSLAYNCSATLGAIVSGVLFARIKHIRWQFFTIAVLQCSFTASAASITQHTPARAIVLIAMGAFCVGASQVLATLIVQFGAEDHQIGVATGLSGTFRATGGSIAIAIYSTIIRSYLTGHLGKNVSNAALAAGLPVSSLPSFLKALLAQSATALKTVKGVTPTIVAAAGDGTKPTYAHAYRTVFLASIAFGGELLLVL
ncbi:uncharacterized protein PV07_00700 [Cladophialophora immunda]|uniref:Major facilitator superfamily (MFS) profile domain-containing protein n=1 Tax=Cladophialophora immunda TaxID=569365 RepID=A0A0D2CVJ5_9EURO|nr:uncharacterized protein PV07_00700 [Cladophialophora immunda]KIW33885.1 hypothetical protein PV07_00700 [Cladophialophora immunda]